MHEDGGLGREDWDLDCKTGKTATVTHASLSQQAQSSNERTSTTIDRLHRVAFGCQGVGEKAVQLVSSRRVGPWQVSAYRLISGRRVGVMEKCPGAQVHRKHLKYFVRSILISSGQSSAYT
jgi:hypothetical protein